MHSSNHSLPEAQRVCLQLADEVKTTELGAALASVLQAGQVVWLLAFLAVAAGLVLAAESILRLLLQRPVVGLLAGMVLMLLLVMPSILLPWSVAQVPALLVLVLGLVLLAGGAAWAWQRDPAEPSDAITSPVPGAESPKTSRRRLLRTLAVPMAAVVCAGGLLLFS